MNKVIPIFFTIDNSYAPYLNIALKSIIENASKEYDYKIIVLHEELDDFHKERISSLANNNFTIEFKEMGEELENITDRAENRLRCDYFTLTIYYRLFIADMFPEYDKGIYIDSDIVVLGDISELYNKDLGNNLIGACPDHSVVDIPQLAKYMEKAIGISRYKYINSGVLLMNLKKLREIKFSKQFLTLLNKYHFDCIAPDQDYINAMCYGEILYLEECWDAMPQEGKKPLENPKLIHYNLFEKPWHYDNVSYEEYFWKYAKESVYYKDVLECKNNYTNEQKKSDAEHMELLLYKADTIPETEVTFKKMFDQGEKIRA